MRYLRPQGGAALVRGRVEASSATPLALLLIATLGRWPAALAMGSVMAVFAAVFLFLLEDDPTVDDIRAWADRRRLGRLLEWLGGRPAAVGGARPRAAAPPRSPKSAAPSGWNGGRGCPPRPGRSSPPRRRRSRGTDSPIGISSRCSRRPRRGT